MPKRRMNERLRQGGWTEFPTLRTFHLQLKTQYGDNNNNNNNNSNVSGHTCKIRRVWVPSNKVTFLRLSSWVGVGVSHVGDPGCDHRQQQSTVCHVPSNVPFVTKGGGGEGGRCPFVQANMSSTDCVCV